MVTYRGYKTTVLYKLESVMGTPVTVDAPVKGKIQNMTINQTNNLIRVAALGAGRNEVFVGFGNYECSWSMEYNPAAFDFLEIGVGDMGGSGTTAAPYYLAEADFRDYTTGMKTATIEVSGLDVSGGTFNTDTLISAVINTIGISIELNAPLKCTLEGYAQNVISKATTGETVTADTTLLWIFSQGAFKWNGTAVGRVQSATININNNYDPDIGRELGSRVPQEFEPGLRKYDWTIVAKMTSAIATTMRDAFYGQANEPDPGVASSEPTFYDIILDFAEGAASTDRVAQILLSDCSINDIAKPINIGDNLVEVTINGAAKRGTNDTTNRPFKWWTIT